MKTETAANLPLGKKKPWALIILLIITAVMLAAATVFAYLTLQQAGVYKGVYVGSHDVSGMSREDMLDLLESIYTIPASGLEITLKTDLAELKASYPELGVIYDVDAAAEKAYSTGRTGNVFIRLYDIARAAFRGTEVPVVQSYDENKIDDFVNKFSDMAFRKVEQGVFRISDDDAVIKSGWHGEAVDSEEIKSLVISMIENGSGGVIRPGVILTEPTRFDAGTVYDRIVCDPENAYYRMEDGKLVLVAHKRGRHIDRAELEQIISEINNTENLERRLPVIHIMPEITSDAAVSMLFRDELAVYSTSFETRTQNDKNRMHNIALAAGKYDNYILMPGEEFSFNNVVGSRNEKTGYKPAHVYINGRVEDGIGGGICQAVSTLYNAVLLSDLEVVERRNHSFTVNYVPLGQDATAYYGGTDLRFINNTGWPIKIQSWVDENEKTVNVVFTGTKAVPDKIVVISTKTLSRTPYKTKYADDPTLPVGTVKKSQYGTDGYVVETYKTVRIGDKVVSQEKLHSSRYNPCNEEFLVGIRQPDGTLTPGLAAQMANKASSSKTSTTGTADTSASSGNDQEAAGTSGSGSGARETAEGDTAVSETTGNDTSTSAATGNDADAPSTSEDSADTPEASGSGQETPAVPGSDPKTPEATENDPDVPAAQDSIPLPE